MKRKLIIGLVVILIGCQKHDLQESGENYQPNIILIMSDDQGWGDAGYQGHPHLKTPNLDSMAANGLVFNRFYAAAPVCSPTRGSVITGRHPFRYGIYYANVGHIPAEEITLPEILQEYGYSTGHFGKWHLGVMDKNVIESNRGGFARTLPHYSPPWENGYQVTFATESKVPTWDPMINPDSVVSGENKSQRTGDSYGTYYWTGEGCIATDNLQGDDSRVIMDRVLPFISQSAQSGKPFFASIWFHTPHSPVIAGEKYRQMYTGLSENEQHYFGSITAMDEQIGRLRNELRQFGIAENTMIWFCSDNGPAAHGGGPGLHPGARQQGSTGGLRGRKGTLYEGGVRVPGILEWPAEIRKARTTNVPAVTSDYLPTLIDLLKLKVDNLSAIDGISLKPVVLENQESRDQGIGFQSKFRGQMYQVWTSDRYKLIRIVEDDSYELYDINANPAESENLLESEPAVAEQMKKQLTDWVESTSRDWGSD